MYSPLIHTLNDECRDMFTLRAPAKINWFLDVFGKRQDGYHDIVSLMQCTTLCDAFTFEHSSDMDLITDAPIPLTDNLVYKAMLLMKKVSGVGSGARITLKKEIPMAAGLGGGSSDAACTLTGLNRLWELGMTEPELARLGEMLGSDVPFFFHGPVALAEGRGEIVSPVTAKRSHLLALVKPAVDVSTAWAYTERDNNRDNKEYLPKGVLTKEQNSYKLFCQALERGDFSFLSTLQRNDLEPIVLRRYPVIGDIKRALIQAGALFSSMSGSGPTVFGVFESEEKAAGVMEHLSPHWCRTVRTLTSDEPVMGS
jgi:4-diphosphocytidyl-2-C-methyl-D-erythritol kinase